LCAATAAACANEETTRDARLSAGEKAAPGGARSIGTPLAASPFPNALAGEERFRPAGQPGAIEVLARKLVTPTELDKTRYRLGTVVGSYVEGGKTGRYSWIVDGSPAAFEQPALKGDEATAVVPAPRARLAASLAQRLEASAPSDLVPVIVTLKGRLATRLDEPDLSPLTTLDPFTQSGTLDLRARRASRITLRKNEAGSLQAGLKGWLAARNVTSVGDFWAVNALAARVPASLIAELSQHPDVARVELDHPLTTTTSTVWDGENVKATSGLNAGFYIDNGYLGDRVNPKFGFPISIGVLDFFFADDHPVFQHSNGFTKIVGEFSCKNGGACVGGLPAPGASDEVHGSWCASAAAAAAMNGQISGFTTAQERDRTGVAEQTELTFVSTGAISDTIHGLQAAVNWDADVVTESFGGGDGVCDGFDAGWEAAVYSAYQAGVMVVGSAGNDGHPGDGSCKLTGLAEAPSQFVVGATDDPGSGAYATAGIASYSSQGGISVTIGGTSFTNVFTAVDAVVPGRWTYGADKASGYADESGTSLAAPQVAGVAALFKDWMIGLGFADFSNVPGVLFANVLAMTDRTTSFGKAASGFDRVWGGGRLQTRYFEQPDHPSGLWRWETASYQVGNGAHVQHLVGGAGNEPAGIQTFKVYAVFFEQDGSDVADIDMTVYDKGCGTGKVVLGSDASRDMKSMVSIGSAGSGKDVCVDLYGFHVPPNETRDVVVVAYYTDETSMR
jgi:hypothetical protein